MQTDNLKLEYFGATDIGLVRNENQDSFGKYPLDSDDKNQPKGLLFIVADGMGGHIGGKDASNLAIEIVSKEYYSFDSEIVANCLKYAFKTANFRINQSSRDQIQSHRKGTTCSALVIEKNLAHIAHVGDSRIYRINKEKIEQLTNDHTQVEEMLRKGILSKEEAINHPAKSILVRALGIESEVEVDIIENIQISAGDNFVICSDGLAKVLPEEIKRIVLSNSTKSACSELVQLANERGGHDNVTVQLIRMSGKVEDEYDEAPVKVLKSGRSRTKPIILVIVLILLIVLAIIFQKKIVIFFSAESGNDTMVNNIIPLNEVINANEILIEQAKKYLNEDKLDSALLSYRLILSDNPMHVGALNGIEAVADKFIIKGDLSTKRKDYHQGLEYYQRAAELKPNDKNIASLIAYCKKEIKNESELNENRYNNNPTNGKDLEDQGNPEEQTKSNSILSSFVESEWIFQNLNENDYLMDPDVLTFFNSQKLKKGYFTRNMEDVDVKVNLILSNKSSTERAGIIVGFNESGKSNEIYYLFSADIFGNFLLKKYSNGAEEKLVSVQRKITPVNNTYMYNLKIKCLGPWIMIYNDGKLLESWLNKDFVKGKIGLFADSGTNAEFSNFKVTSAFENREKK